jgi:hypothetical protein
MTTTQSHSIEALVGRDTGLLEGVTQELPSTSFIVNDAPCTSQDVVDVLNDRIGKANAVLAARAALASAMKAMRDGRAQSDPFVSAFRAIVKGMFKDPGTLARFGIPPRRAPKPTLTTKVARHERPKQPLGTPTRRPAPAPCPPRPPRARAPRDARASPTARRRRAPPR